jgi:hypothetical protein
MHWTSLSKHGETALIGMPNVRFRAQDPIVRYWPANDRSPAIASLNFGLFRHLKSIVDLNAEIANRTFQLGMSEQQLYRPKVLRSPVDQ